MTDAWTLGAIFGMAVVTVVTRSFFFLSARAWPLPRWLERGLQYAPIAALAAVVMPEVLASPGMLAAPWRDARLLGALAGIAAFYLRRQVLATMVAGLGVYLPLRLLLGW